MLHPFLAREANVLRSALFMVVSAGFAMESATALAQDQGFWSGQAQCQLTVDSPAYTYQEIQTWTITGAPKANGPAIYPGTWSVVGQGQRQEIQGTQTTSSQWATSVQPISASLTIFINSAHQLIIKPYHAQLRSALAVTGSRQVTLSGVAQRPSAISFAEFEWQFPAIEVEATRTDVSGTSSTPVASSIGPMQPPRLPGIANCQWQFRKGGAGSSASAVSASQPKAQGGDAYLVSPATNSPGVVTAPLAASSSGTTISPGQGATTPGGNLPGKNETSPAPAATRSTDNHSSSRCQAVARSQDPMIMGSLHAGKSVSHTGKLTSVKDSDFFQIKLPAGEDLTISLTGMQSGSDFDLYVYDSNYSPIDCSLTRGTASENLKTQFGHLQKSNVVIVEVRPYALAAESSKYLLKLDGKDSEHTSQ